MAWAVHAEWKGWIDLVKDELGAVIREISRFEPVRLLAPPDELANARARFSGQNIEIVEAPVDDIWMRDIAPIFALRSGEIVAIDLNFNAWGNTRPRRPGDRLAATAGATFGLQRILAPFVAEGGALITDGDGTLITTESCLLNQNRNAFGRRTIRKDEIERGMGGLGVRRVIWLKGDPTESVTNGHIDGYAMFTAPGSLLVESAEDEDMSLSRCRKHDIAILEATNDAAGRTLQIERVRPPRKRHWRFRGRHWAPCYLNAYIANGAVIASRFDDPERDEATKAALARAFPGRKIIMLRIDHIASGGGGIRCLTQPMVKTARKSEELYDRN
jgi:agmatine deiminase